MMDLLYWFFLLWRKGAARVDRSVFHIITGGPLARQLIVGAWVDVGQGMLHLMTGDFRQLKLPLRDLRKQNGLPELVPDFSKLSITDFGDTLRCGSTKFSAEDLLRLIEPKHNKGTHYKPDFWGESE